MAQVIDSTTPDLTEQAAPLLEVNNLTKHFAVGGLFDNIKVARPGRCLVHDSSV